MIYIKLVLIYCFFLFCVISNYAQHLVINEIQSSNATTIADEDGDYEDWIELYNGTDTAINLAGFGFSDSFSETSSWLFPEIEIPAGEFLLVFASGKDKCNANEIHTNFSLDKNGQFIVLRDTNNLVIDYILPTYIAIDISLGRVPDGSTIFKYFIEPSPGNTNSNNYAHALLKPPIFSEDGGNYSNIFELELVCEFGGDIYFTTDGSYPDSINGTRYSSQIIVDKTCIIRAKSYKHEAIPSEPSHMIYNFISNELINFSSDLPIIIINQYDTLITANERSISSISVIDTEQDQRAYLSESSTQVQSRILANYRGNSSLTAPKKMIGFHLIDENDYNNNIELLGLPSEHNWILNAPYRDFTLLRNRVSYQLSEDMGRYAPRTAFVELFLHEGGGLVNKEHYNGLYLLVERIKWDNNRVNIRKIRPNDNQEPYISGGYIIKRDRPNPGEHGFTTSRGTNLLHVRPQENDISPEQKQWITEYMNSFENALYSDNFSDTEIGYQKYIDLNSFIDHFLITELLKEIDGFRLSTFMYKDINEKLTMGPVWDFNFSLGIADYLDGWMPEGWYFHLIENCPVINWYKRILEDTNARFLLRNRWKHLRTNVFSEEHLINLIEHNQNLILEAQERNFARWDIIGSYVWPNWYLGEDWQDEVNWMKNWLMQRLIWMDNQLGSPEENPELFTICYWFFDDQLPNNEPISEIESSFFVYESGTLKFNSAQNNYPYPCNHPLYRKSSLERRNKPSPLNYIPNANDDILYHASNMRGIQVREPFKVGNNENSITISASTENFSHISLKFAAINEGAAENLKIEYSVDATENWILHSMPEDKLKLHKYYELYSIDFSEVNSVNDNPNFKIRISFEADDLTKDSGKRVTFNNFGVFAKYNTGIDNIDFMQNKLLISQNYPNPFDEFTEFSFYIPENTKVNLSLMDINGRIIKTIADDYMEKGFHKKQMSAENLSPGIYIYQIITDKESSAKRLIISK